MKQKLIIAFFLIFVFLSTVSPSYSQEINSAIDSPSTQASEVSTPSAKHEVDKKQEDLTKPEEEEAKKEFIALFSKRPIEDVTFLNFIGFFVQYAVRSGVPANTIILILLLPFLAIVVVFVRQIIGIPTLEMFVPIALAITLVATGIAAGTVLLGTIIFASAVARLILRKIRIMQLPKMALSMLLVSVFVLGSLTVTTSLGLLNFRQFSFFPVLLLILLSDKIVGLYLARGNKSTLIITFFTLALGAAGFTLLSLEAVRNFVLLYPESILILIPINIIMGRYFGLRLTEFYRFAAFRKYVGQ